MLTINFIELKKFFISWILGLATEIFYYYFIYREFFFSSNVFSGLETIWLYSCRAACFFKTRITYWRRFLFMFIVFLDTQFNHSFCTNVLFKLVASLTCQNVELFYETLDGNLTWLFIIFLSGSVVNLTFFYMALFAVLADVFTVLKNRCQVTWESVFTFFFCYCRMSA